MPYIYRPEPAPKAKRNYRTTSKRDNANHKAVYNTLRWTVMRLEKLKRNPLCEICEKNGKIKSAIDVHHIVPISTGVTIAEKQSLGFNPENLKSVCKECHKDQHNNRINTEQK